MIKKLPHGIHLEVAKGNAESNFKYCSKNNKTFERGSPKQQGKRTDLLQIKNDIANGKTVDEITLENPELYHQYGRTLERIETILLRKKWRKWMTTCDWYYGPTGIGKSHKAFENFDPEKCYVFNLNDNGCDIDVIWI